MNKLQKALNKLQNLKERREKNIQRSVRRQKEKKEDLINCPFDVEMNGRYGTCTCGGDNRESCGMAT